MYRLPEAGERLGFGDVVSGSWLFDLYLRHDAVALSPQIKGQGRLWLENRAPRADRAVGKDAVLSHADEALGFGNPRMAIILTDDCELDALQRKAVSGRILLAGIRPAAEPEVLATQQSGTYRLFGLPADHSLGFDGGIVELQRIFSVYLPSLTDSTTHARILSLESEAQALLSQSLCAHVTRHGPIVAAKEAAKLAMLMTAKGDATAVDSLKRGRVPDLGHQQIANAITQGLRDAWALEGAVLDELSEAWERGDGPEASVAAIKVHLRLVRDAFDEALRRMDGEGDPS